MKFSLIIFVCIVIGIFSVSALELTNEKTLYPVNENGQTYGKDIYANTSVDEPDLIATYATNGKLGYIKATDLEDGINNPSEAIKKQNNKKEHKIIPVYDKEGKIIIGEFMLQ